MMSSGWIPILFAPVAALVGLVLISILGPTYASSNFGSVIHIVGAAAIGYGITRGLVGVMAA